ncbi:MAG: DUF2480 family protein [Bacteroidota bacterium]
MEGEIINKVARSPLVTFKLEEIYPEGERVLIDIKDQLFQGLILREKDFRAWVKDHDWSQYEGKYVAITCSVDAIVQVWAYMLMQTRLAPYAKYVHQGTLASMEHILFQKALDPIDFSQFQDKPVVIKGCSDKPVPASVYVEVTQRMLPFAKKLSYGEPCSTVPLWKRK